VTKPPSVTPVYKPATPVRVGVIAQPVVNIRDEKRTKNKNKDRIETPFERKSVYNIYISKSRKSKLIKFKIKKN
jgi:hypothetical protein